MISSEELDLVLEQLKLARGIDLSGYRRNTLHRRIITRMVKLNIRVAMTYLELLRSDPAECDRLIDTIAVNVSSFFRDPLVFEVLARRVIPLIIAMKRSGFSRETRTWSAGCAMGEEAYSTAIIFQESLKEELEAWQHMIFATDIDGEALAAARAGIFPRSRLANVRLGQLDRYFIPVGTDFEIHPRLREMVLFSRHDITSPTSSAPAESIFGTFDLILCRNMLIYFKPDLQRKIMIKLYKALAPGAFLVLGSAESLIPEIESKFNTIDKWTRIYQKRV